MRTFAKKPNVRRPASAGSTIFGQTRAGQAQVAIHRATEADASQRQTGANTAASEAETAAARPDWNFSRIPVHAAASARLQTKLELGTPGDVYEQEADRVAEQVMRMPEPSQTPHQSQIHRTGGVASPEEARPTPEFQSQLANSKGNGQSLDDSIRSEMELKMRADFSGVKIHTGADAHNLSESIDARAFAHGSDVYFNAGQYDPRSMGGRKLLAHELTHTLQQRESAGTIVQTQKAGAKPKKKKSKASSQKNNLKTHVIKVVVHENIKYYKIGDLYNDLQIVAKGEFDEVRMEQQLNVGEKIGEGAKGRFFISLYGENPAKQIKETVPIISLNEGEEVIVRTVTELTSLRETYKNYDQVKSRMDELEAAQPQYKGKMYLRTIWKGDTLDGLAQATWRDNETSYARLSKILPMLNEGIKVGVVGNAAIVLKGWKDPNIGTMPEKPDAKVLTENQKQLIAILYGEIHGAAYVGTTEQIKYIFYSLVLRVKSPDFVSDIYDVATSGAYQAFNAKQYRIAKTQLDQGKPEADLVHVRDTVIGAWNNAPPADAGFQYSHYSASSTDAVKISSYYTGAAGKIDEAKENEAAYDFLVEKKWNTGGLSKTKGWKKRIRLSEGKLEGTMYVFN